jgi:hypothetical protein
MSELAAALRNRFPSEDEKVITLICELFSQLDQLVVSPKELLEQTAKLVRDAVISLLQQRALGGLEEIYESPHFQSKAAYFSPDANQQKVIAAAHLLLIIDVLTVGTDLLALVVVPLITTKLIRIVEI